MGHKQSAHNIVSVYHKQEIRILFFCVSLSAQSNLDVQTELILDLKI